MAGKKRKELLLSQDFKDLIVYKKAFRLAMEIFRLSKGFPKPTYQSTYCQRTGQTRLWQAGIGTDMANSETPLCYRGLDFALACKYISKDIDNNLTNQSKEIGRPDTSG